MRTDQAMNKEDLVAKRSTKEVKKRIILAKVVICRLQNMRTNGNFDRNCSLGECYTKHRIDLFNLFILE